MRTTPTPKQLAEFRKLSIEALDSSIALLKKGYTLREAFTDGHTAYLAEKANEQLST